MQACICCCASKAQSGATELDVTDVAEQIITESPKADALGALVRTTTGRILGEIPGSDESTSESDDDSGLMRFRRTEQDDDDDDEVLHAGIATLVKTKMLAMRWRERTVSKHLSASTPTLLRASPSMVLESKELATPAMNTSERRAEAPMFEEILEGANVHQIRDLLLLESDDCPLQVFLREVMDCTDLMISPWMLCNVGGGADVQRSSYKLPVKTDVPSAVTAVLGIPKFVTGCSLNCVMSTQGDVMLLQRSKVQGVKYSDRFRVQNLHTFSPDGAGNVRWSMWLEVECIKALPWTHSFLQKHITDSTRSEAEMTGPKFVAILRRALSKAAETDFRTVRSAPAP